MDSLSISIFRYRNTDEYLAYIDDYSKLISILMKTPELGERFKCIYLTNFVGNFEEDLDNILDIYGTKSNEIIAACAEIGPETFGNIDMELLSEDEACRIIETYLNDLGARLKEKGFMYVDSPLLIIPNTLCFIYLNEAGEQLLSALTKFEESYSLEEKKLEEEEVSE